LTIPICLVTGFLGSGKTTFLKHVLARCRDRRLVFLVNEFSPRDVDGARMMADAADVVTVPGGSIFCKCLVVGFLQQLKRIPERFDTPAAPLAGLVIEASGIANPKVVQQMLAETHMDAIYRLASIVSIVEPRSFQKLLHTLPNIAAQVEAADHVLVNKVDLCEAAETEAACAAVRRLNARCTVIRTTRARAELDLFGAAPARALQGEYASCADPHYGRLQVLFDGPVDAEELLAALRGLGEDVYRAKGTLPGAKGLCGFDYAFGGVAEAGGMPAGSEAGLAVIVAGGAESRVRQGLEAIPNLVCAAMPEE